MFRWQASNNILLLHSIFEYVATNGCVFQSDSCVGFVIVTSLWTVNRAWHATSFNAVVLQDAVAYPSYSFGVKETQLRIQNSLAWRVKNISS